MRVLIAGAVLMLWPSIAAAESYDVLSWNQDRLAAVDRDSVTESAGLKRVRIAVIYAQAKGEGAGAYRGMVGLQEFDCAQGRFHTLESAPFDDSGTPVAPLATHEPTAWTTITRTGLRRRLAGRRLPHQAADPGRRLPPAPRARRRAHRQRRRPIRPGRRRHGAALTFPRDRGSAQAS